MIEIEQAAIADIQEKIAETHELLKREKEFGRRHQEMMERRLENAIRIGQNLLDFKTTLPHGKFITFVQTEFGMSQATANDYMLLARQAANSGVHQNLSLDVNIELASPSMPPTVIEMVEAGQIPPTVAAIRAAKQAERHIEGETERVSLADIFDPVGHAIPSAYFPSEDHLPASSKVLDTPQGGSIMHHPVEIDRVMHDARSLEEVRESRDAHIMRVMGSSDSPEWYTPQKIVQLSIELLGEIDLDPCSNSHESPNVPAGDHYTKEDNGLLKPWKGKVYLNPPYGSEIPQWVEKLVNSYGHGVTEAIALLPGRIDTLWFSPLYAFPMCNVRGRIQYENSPHHAPFPCVIVYLGNRLDDFIRVFGDEGPIMKKVGGR